MYILSTSFCNLDIPLWCASWSRHGRFTMEGSRPAMARSSDNENQVNGEVAIILEKIIRNMGWSWCSFLNKHRSYDAFVICARWSQRLFFQTLQNIGKHGRKKTHRFHPTWIEVWSGFFDWAALLQKNTKALQKYDPILGFSGIWLHNHVSQSLSTYRFQWLPECIFLAWGVCCRVFPEYSNNWGIDESWDSPMRIIIMYQSLLCDKNRKSIWSWSWIDFGGT